MQIVGFLMMWLKCVYRAVIVGLPQQMKTGAGENGDFFFFFVIDNFLGRQLFHDHGVYFCPNLL